MSIKTEHIFVAPGFVESGGQLLCEVGVSPETEKEEDKEQEKKEIKEPVYRKTWISTPLSWLGIGILCLLAIVFVFAVGLLVSACLFGYLEWHFNLSYAINCLIVVGAGVLITVISGLAISSVKSFEKKSIGWAFILTFFLFPGMFYSVYHSRGDNFDRKTGKPMAWVVPSTGRVWRETKIGPISLSRVPEYSPLTGEKLVPMSTKLQKLLEKKKRTHKSRRYQQQAYRVYYPGTYYFTLKAGEETDHWIMFPYGRQNNYSFSSQDYNYVIIYDDGSVVKDGPSVCYPLKTRVKCKLRAITDQKIRLVLK